MVLATYNGEHFLAEQLTSLANQLRPPDEVVVVDDASHDHTVALLRDFRVSAPFKVRIVDRKHHLGTAATFAEAMEMATGDIIVICDQDDRWRSDKISVLVDRMRAEPNALLAFSDARLIDANGALMDPSRWRVAGFSARQVQAMARDSFGQMMSRQIMSGCTSAVRAELIPALLPFPSGLHPDLPDMIYDRWISLLAAAVGPVALVTDQLVDYRIHRDQQIGIPALKIRRLAPRAALHLAQFRVTPEQVEQRTEFHRIHIQEIDRRLLATGLTSSMSDRQIQEADEHLRLRTELSPARAERVGPVLREFRSGGGYRRFSLGVATALSDLIR